MAERRILLIGYNGANNIGAEALLADVADVRAVFGGVCVVGPRNGRPMDRVGQV